MADYRTLRLVDDDGHVEVVLHRPDSLNALNRQMARELTAALTQVRESDARAVLLRGEGRGFCAGGDVKDMQSTFERHPAAFFDEPLRDIHAAVRALAELPLPVVCAVHGFASGAGFNLALGADFIVCAEDARLNQAFVRIGLVPDSGGTFNLPRRIGTARALELFLLGDFVSAEQAKELGIVQRVVPADRLLDEARALTARLASGPTRAYAEIKQLVRHAATATLDEALDAEREAQLRVAETDDFKEGVRALLEKRPPRFTGA